MDLALAGRSKPLRVQVVEQPPQVSRGELLQPFCADLWPDVQPQVVVLDLPLADWLERWAVEQLIEWAWGAAIALAQDK